MTEMTQRDSKLVQYLNEAYATERRLEIALQAHIAMTPRRDYKDRLRDHLKETKAHARGVARRIKQLGGEAETVSLPGPEPLAKGVRAAQTAIQQAAAVAQGPLHAVRGTGQQERMLKNARTEFQDEAEEIATYRAIEALAKGVGDKETAKLARDIQREEKRMADFLGGIIDELALDVVHDEVPVSEINGPGARRAATRTNGGRTAAPSGSGGSSRAASASKSRGSRSAAAKSGSSRSAAAKSGSSRSAAAKSGTSRSSSAAKSGSSRSASAAKPASRAAAKPKSASGSRGSSRATRS